MIWTAIIKRDNTTRATTFTDVNSPGDAFRNIWKVLVSDGYEVLGVMKGNQVESFYGVDLDTLEVQNPDPLKNPDSGINGV